MSVQPTPDFRPRSLLGDRPHPFAWEETGTAAGTTHQVTNLKSPKGGYFEVKTAVISLTRVKLLILKAAGS